MKNNNSNITKADIVLTFGTFDLFHDGHRFFLTEAKKLGQKLIVVVARDINVKALKGNFPKQSEDKRIKTIDNLKIADKVILGSVNDRLKVLRDVQPDIIALGFDQHAPTEEIIKILPNIKIVRLSSHFPQKFKSTIIRKKLEEKK